MGGHCTVKEYDDRMCKAVKDNSENESSQINPVLVPCFCPESKSTIIGCAILLWILMKGEFSEEVSNRAKEYDERMHKA